MPQRARKWILGVGAHEYTGIGKLESGWNAERKAPGFSITPEGPLKTKGAIVNRKEPAIFETQCAWTAPPLLKLALLLENSPR
jgi:hypothetical protein